MYSSLVGLTHKVHLIFPESSLASPFTRCTQSGETWRLGTQESLNLGGAHLVQVGMPVNGSVDPLLHYPLATSPARTAAGNPQAEAERAGLGSTQNAPSIRCRRPKEGRKRGGGVRNMATAEARLTQGPAGKESQLVALPNNQHLPVALL